MDKLNVESWVERETLTHGGLSEHQSAQALATLDAGDAPQVGDPIPPLWHWCAFPITAPNDALVATATPEHRTCCHRPLCPDACGLAARCDFANR